MGEVTRLVPRAERQDLLCMFLDCSDVAAKVHEVRCFFPQATDDELRAAMREVADMEEKLAVYNHGDVEARELFREHAALLRQVAAELPPRRSPPCARPPEPDWMV